MGEINGEVNSQEKIGEGPGWWRLLPAYESDCRGQAASLECVCRSGGTCRRSLTPPDLKKS